ncbi:MAG: lytic transglycosylase [Burkholderiales bacterium PBB6]|nr:MAG: lytic transglycosylase [Burkholderiales bacterium PBB6]
MQSTSPAGTGAARQVARAPGTQLLLDAAAAPTNATPAAQSPVLATTTQAVAGSQDETMVTAPIDPLNPDQPVNLDDKTANRDLWVRVRRGFTMSDLDDDYVRRFEQYYATRPDYVKRMTERGGRYLFHVVQEIEKRNMPTELALLPFIESAFNPQAMSTAKASGMWQFIPSTGKDYSLTQNVFRDDRRNVLASTRAALDYLDRLHDMFGDWHLALAAYNWGQGNVQRAITRNQKAGLPTDYASLKMPDETRQYVPKLQAVKNIVMQPDQYKLELPALKNHPYFLSVPIERDIDLDLAAKLAGVSLDEFKSLNPQMNKPVILAAGTEQVLLPYENAASFVEKLRNHRGQLATWTAWVAPKTLRPAEAAKEVGMSEAQLRDVNRIPPKMLVKAGSTLLVPRSATRTADVSEHVADHASIALAPDVPPLKKVTLKAGKKGETVASIAKRYRTTPAQVASWNKVAANGTFKAGSAIVVFVPNATKVAAARPAPASVKPAANTKGKATAVAIAKPTVKTAPARTSGAAKTPAPRNRAAIRLADH